MNNPKHSIIVPAYNTGNAIRQCIDSVLKQTYPNWELIIVDDGSKDNTSEIIDEYAKNDNRIKVFHIPNEGVSYARNVGLAAAQGEYVMFVDSDDWIELDYLQQVGNHMDDDADMYIVGITQDHEDNNGNIYYSEIKGTPVYRHISSVNLHSEIGYLLNTINMESSCLKSYRASFLRKHNIKFMKGMIVFEDFYFVLQCLYHQSSISLIPFIGYHYRMELDYNPVVRRGRRDFYPSISNLFKMLDLMDMKLGLSSYSHEQVMRVMTAKISVVLNQSLYATKWADRAKPFKMIFSDATIKTRIKEILNIAGGRFRLQYKLMGKGMFNLAYIAYRYL
ncbi:glycosyltransferase family 2 protein [uncultured Bacteroides sp.]|uniref:glycosyltransferase family 2 protein n=1 Tax=uncultured Bacteroides sp. TaxID=162156 RepID=UPI0008206D04|nr:glycosyltransferase family 2 protein [uncultured Bacteroides sp.]SCH85682.1 Hyaluronan synthase [uncultured Bacteroides sp.]